MGSKTSKGKGKKKKDGKRKNGRKNGKSSGGGRRKSDDTGGAPGKTRKMWACKACGKRFRLSPRLLSRKSLEKLAAGILNEYRLYECKKCSRRSPLPPMLCKPVTAKR